MGNPFFKAMGGGQNQRGIPANIMQSFQQFMGQMQGKDPNAILNQLISSGRISQSQLDVAQKQAQQLQGMFEGMQGMVKK